VLLAGRLTHEKVQTDEVERGKRKNGRRRGTNIVKDPPDIRFQSERGTLRNGLARIFWIEVPPDARRIFAISTALRTQKGPTRLEASGRAPSSRAHQKKNREMQKLPHPRPKVGPPRSDFGKLF